MLHAWQTASDQDGVARAVLVDFKEAFDLVNHNLLLQKLLIGGVPHFLIKCFFSQRVYELALTSHHHHQQQHF